MTTDPNTAVDQQSTSPLLLGIVLLEFSIGTVIILFRTYTKFFFIKEAEKWSYFWALLTWVTGLINCTAVSLSVGYGLGRHIYVLTESNVINALKWSWVSDGTSRFGTAFARAAVAAFIYGIQGAAAPRWRKIILWFAAISNIVLNVFIVFVLFFRCDPPAFVWNKTIPGGKCPLEEFNQYAAYAILGYGGATDLLLAFYPITIFSRLHMPTRTKITLSILFSFGVFACVCAAMTTYELHTITTTTDPTYVLTPVTIWAVTEMWVILIASSVPPLYPLLRQIFSFCGCGRGSNSRRGSSTTRHTSFTSRQSTFVSTHSGTTSQHHATATSSSSKLNNLDPHSLQITVVRDFDVHSVERDLEEAEVLKRENFA